MLNILSLFKKKQSRPQFNFSPQNTQQIKKFFIDKKMCPHCFATLVQDYDVEFTKIELLKCPICGFEGNR